MAAICITFHARSCQAAAEELARARLNGVFFLCVVVLHHNDHLFQFLLLSRE